MLVVDRLLLDTQMQWQLGGTRQVGISVGISLFLLSDSQLGTNFILAGHALCAFCTTFFRQFCAEARLFVTLDQQNC